MRVGECVTVRRPLSGLGQASAPAPLLEYMSSLRRAEAQLSYLAAATPSNWEVRIDDTLKLLPAEFKYLEMAVRGKTGNPEAEKKLFELWGTVHRTMLNMIQNKPSLIAQLKDKASIFFTDFWQGAKEAQQGYANWAIEKAGPALKLYHDGLQKLAIFKKDLAEAKVAGRPAAEIAQQEAKIATAESWANKVRSTFSAISSGASIDKLATDKYGALSGPIAAALIGAAITLVISLIAEFLIKISDIKPLVARLMPLIDKIDKSITETAKGANIAIATGKEKMELLVPVIIGSLALIAGGAFYYFVIRKRGKTE